MKSKPTSLGGFFCLLFAGLLVARNLSAQDITETWNDTFGLWNNPNNWTPADVPNNGGGTNYIATVGSGGPVMGNDVLLDGLNYTGGNISGLYNITVFSNLNVSGTDRVLGNGSLILAPGSQSQWTSGNFSIWGTTQIHNYGMFTTSYSSYLNMEIDPVHSTRDTFGGHFLQ